MKFRGQSSLEYLTTYGWAILVLLATGLVLWQMGVLSFGQQVAAGKSGFMDVTPLDWAATSGGALSVVVVNNAASSADVGAASATITAGGTGGCASGAGGDVPPGGSVELSLSCSFTAAQGDYWRAELRIPYEISGSTITHTSVGEVWGPLN